MDLCSLNLNNRNLGLFTAKKSSFPQRNLWLETPFSSDSGKMGLFRNGHRKVSEIRVLKFRCSSYRPIAVKATAKKNDENSSSSGNNDQSLPNEDGPEMINPSLYNSRSEDAATHKSHHANLDWRTLRATYVGREQGTLSQDDVLGSKWAHSIPVTEAGCVLVATDKLDDVRAFQRSVVLLLRPGTKDLREGPFGLIINRPLHKKIKDMNPSNLDLATTLADCSLYFGGPLDASMFLLKTENSDPLPGFVQVIPGISCGARDGLDEAAGLVKKGVLRPQDFRFFVGYAGWEMDQLGEEIEMGYWIVAACSVELMIERTADSSPGLWEDILQLMGGHYSELIRKPKQDGS
ncbi:hypothetical protein MRB53_022799 [Persea americana]|uniref:Uncharacterized protein n=1 Tax=Persea americana TaxID=3435 RepID=A0ACC2L7S8_PERAE|nr:hypothetical protein MRB53_022799 [Persea americana]|eukprot:TRINITY_DN32946_c0_g1_i2.p1 TRINITY_DN32946_c0_g1~~TRINITY_DN32946_c0_g1_i2.p1  ORF type:complete len:349 (-),score=83.47 TRINITY_DN32946_c0_g1_i2:254-1300(-)